MIKSFADRMAKDIYDGINSRYSRKLDLLLHAKAQRLFDQINAAPSLEFLRIPPGNQLEKMRGGLSGYWSLRINERWRIIFRWIGNDAYDLKIIDYH